MKFLASLLIAACAFCVCFAKPPANAQENALAAKNATVKADADFTLELGANIAVLKKIGNEIYAGLDDGKLYRISLHQTAPHARSEAPATSETQGAPSGASAKESDTQAKDAASGDKISNPENSASGSAGEGKISNGAGADKIPNIASFDKISSGADGAGASGRGTDAKSANGTDKIYAEKSLIFELAPSKNYLDEPVGASIFDVDKLGERYAFLYNGDAFEKMLGIFAGGEITHYKLPMTGIKNLYFYDENTLILLGLGSEILYFDLPSGKVVFEQKLTIASLGGSTYERATGTLLISCEGGIVFYFDTGARKVVKQKSLHKDGIYSVALLGDRMMSGSNDKERSCYYESGEFYKFFNARFAVFAVALSDERGAFSVNNGINVIDKSGEIIQKIKLQRDVVNYLLFTSDYLAGSGYNRYVYFWEIK